MSFPTSTMDHCAAEPSKSKKGFHLRVFFDPMMKPLLYLFSLLMAFARLEAAEAAGRRIFPTRRPS